MHSGFLNHFVENCLIYTAFRELWKEFLENDDSSRDEIRSLFKLTIRSLSRTNCILGFIPAVLTNTKIVIGSCQYNDSPMKLGKSHIFGPLCVLNRKKNIFLGSPVSAFVSCSEMLNLFLGPGCNLYVRGLFNNVISSRNYVDFSNGHWQILI